MYLLRLRSAVAASYANWLATVSITNISLPHHEANVEQVIDMRVGVFKETYCVLTRNAVEG